MFLTMFNPFKVLFQTHSLPYSMFNSLAVKADSLEQYIQIAESIRDYYEPYSNQNDDLAEIAARLECLRSTVQCLIFALQNRHYQPNEVHLVESINRSIADCEDTFTKLHYVKKRNSISIIGPNGSAYPFHPITIQKINKAVDELLQRLSRILDTVRPEEPWQMVFHHDDADFSGPEVLQEHTSISDLCSKIDVLVPDAAVDHCGIYVKRTAETGLWFLEHPSFTK